MNFLNYTYKQNTSYTQHCGVDTGYSFSDSQVQWTWESKPLEFPTLMTKLHYSSSGKEKDSETGLSYFGARYYEPEMLNIWLSVDPMADKYQNLSPYAYCAWNPIKLVDPNGKEIFYREGMDKYVYKKGQDGEYGFYNTKTGSRYSGNASRFVNDLTYALGQLQDGGYGANLVGFFEGNEHDVEIAFSENNYEAVNGVGWNNDKKSLIPVAHSSKDAVQLEETESFVSLGHELAHHRDRQKVGSEKFEHLSIERKESYAMFAENNIRLEHGLRQRTYYGIIKSDYGCGSVYSVDFNSIPALTLPIPILTDPTRHILQMY